MVVCFVCFVSSCLFCFVAICPILTYFLKPFFKGKNFAVE